MPKMLLSVLDLRVGTKITTTTSKLVTFRGDFESNSIHSGSKYMLNNDLNDVANKFDSVFKVF